MASSRHVSLAVQQPYKYNAVALFSTASSDDGASPKTAPHDDDDNNNKESVVGKTESLVENDTSSSATSTTTNTTITTAKLTLRQRWARAFPKRKDDDLPMKQKLAKMGLACVLSYGFVSNLNAVITTAIAWFVFAKRVSIILRVQKEKKDDSFVESHSQLTHDSPNVQTGLSPLAPGQWKPFLAVYTGFWVFNNFIRPIRFAAAVTISPFFDRAVLSFQKRLKVSKPVAIGITVFMTNVVGTTLVLVLGVSAAAALSGTPIFPPKV